MITIVRFTNTYLCEELSALSVTFPPSLYFYFIFCKQGNPWSTSQTARTLSVYNPFPFDCLRPRHLVFPGGLPSKYSPGPPLLSFRDQAGSGVLRAARPRPATTLQGPQFPCVLVNTCCALPLFIGRRPSGWHVALYCDTDLHFLLIEDPENHFVCVSAISIGDLEKHLCKHFTSF